MADPDSAEESLRVIRSLMERATIYRTLSAPAALCVGTLAVVVSSACLLLPELTYRSNFALIWIVVLFVSATANTYFLWKSAKNRREAFPSRRMRTALQAVLPPLICAAVLTVLAWLESPLTLVLVWMLFYGLALLSTATFAPRSLVILGWAFVLIALVLASAASLASRFGFHVSDTTVASLTMGGTFGLFHLIYGGWVSEQSHEQTMVSDVRF